MMDLKETPAQVGEKDVFKSFELALAVKSNDPVNGEYHRLVLEAPEYLLARCQAGQFFHLLCPTANGETPYLRRPMSIYGFYPQQGELHFLYKLAGAGTRALASLTPGDRLNVLGPLGVPFTIEDGWQNLVLVARGVGLATLAPLALEARRLGRKMTAICSARHPDYLMSVDYFRELGADVITLTDAEGTSGVDNLERVIEELIAGGRADAFYTCGSNRILKLLQTIGARHDLPGQIALEQQMACGIGMCHCCVRTFQRGDKLLQLRVCREGPVFDMMEAVAW